VLAAGCSGASEQVETLPAPAPPTAPAPAAAGTRWNDQADAVCAQYHARLEALPRPITAEDTPLLLLRKVDLTRSAAQQLGSLPSRPGAGRLLLAALERRAIALEQLAVAEAEHDDRRAQVAIRAGRRSDGAAGRWSEQLGAAACGRGVFGSRE
jgi:hypothetical protein